MIAVVRSKRLFGRVSAFAIVLSSSLIPVRGTLADAAPLVGVVGDSQPETSPQLYPQPYPSSGTPTVPYEEVPPAVIQPSPIPSPATTPLAGFVDGGSLDAAVDVISPPRVQETTDPLVTSENEEDGLTCDLYSSPDDEHHVPETGNDEEFVILPGLGCDDDPPPLPEECIVLRGDAQWLWCWHLRGSVLPLLAGPIAAGGFLSGCDLTDAQTEAAAVVCNETPRSQDQITCAMDYVRNNLPQAGNVCRHHARCFKKIWEAMNGAQSYIARLLAGTGHAWNEIPTPQGMYYVDSYNTILFWCPSGTA